MSNADKDYRLEIMKIVLKDWEYVPGKHIDEDRFKKGDNVLSLFNAYKIYEKGKEEGIEILLSDLKEFIKAQEEYDEYNERKSNG